jgi:hypothetical protein
VYKCQKVWKRTGKRIGDCALCCRAVSKQPDRKAFLAHKNLADCYVRRLKRRFFSQRGRPLRPVSRIDLTPDHSRLPARARLLKSCYKNLAEKNPGHRVKSLSLLRVFTNYILCMCYMYVGATRKAF